MGTMKDKALTEPAQPHRHGQLLQDVSALPKEQ